MVINILESPAVSIANLFHPEDKGSSFLCSIGNYLPDCMVSQAM